MLRKKSIMDGNMAAAHVAHAVNEVIAIYPITPSSVMGEISDEKSTAGEKNIWGTVPIVTEMQSEAGVAGAVHGALTAGAMTTTFTASQGLLLMIPNMYKIAGELTPTVFHVSARALAAQGLSIFGDHSDVMACRSCGWTMFASSNPQEVMDNALIAQAVTLRSRIPVLHFFDGFRTSHELSVVEELTFDDMRSMINDDLIKEHRKRSLSPDNPTIKGTSQNPDVFFQGRETVNKYMNSVPEIMKEEMDKLSKITGRKYGLVEYSGAEDAEHIIVIMGSGADVAEETSMYLNSTGEKTGVIKIRLFQPFPVEDFIKAIPSTVKTMAVLDRTKEAGSLGEPLYLIVRTAIGEAMGAKITSFNHYPIIVGGRYGLGSKDFTPAMVKGVYDNLKSEKPKTSFTVGINDDVTNTSIDFDNNWVIPTDKVYNAMFFGLGSDGTVGANKNTAKIIFSETGKNVQAYFVYDSKKAGSMTTSHVRFGDTQIKSSYLVQKADFIACHNFSFLERYDILSRLKDGGTFLLNSQYKANEVWDKIPNIVKDLIVKKKAEFYVVDAVEIAKDLGLGSRINVILQTAFFKISNIIPIDQALTSIKTAIKKTYGKYGDEIVEKNSKAADSGAELIEKVSYPSDYKYDGNSGIINCCLSDKSANDFVRNITSKLVEDRGEEIKVSEMPADGTWPVGTARFEKRNIAVNIPVWNEDICIQCGICSFVCPHTAIRMKFYDKDLVKDAPSTFKYTEAKGKEFTGFYATIQVAPEDCTGCSVCEYNCPAISKQDPTKKALTMTPQIPLRESEVENFNFFLSIPELPVDKYNKNSLKGSQLAPHMFEFSGACAGCGETPYIKLLTQLFGDRLLIANATGCSSIYGGNLPTTPYCSRADGLGPAWSNSLFEDNAEFGYGMRLATEYFTLKAKEYLEILKNEIGPLSTEILEADLSNQVNIELQRGRIKELKSKLSSIDTDKAKDLLSIADYLAPKSVWIIGGDGWAYDIGYGGLDHVLASGDNVNILVLDTVVYSNTGGQASKSTPIGASAKFATSGKIQEKKDLAMIAMTYGSIYVAKVSLSNPMQCIKAFMEAEAYNGPSLIIAYSHCIAQGINMTTGVDEQRKAIQAGYWQLMRFNPALMDEGKNPLQIDSKPAMNDLASFMAGENRFRITKKLDSEKYNEIVEIASVKQARRNKIMMQLANNLDYSNEK